MTNTKIITSIIMGISFLMVWVYLSRSREQKIIKEQWSLLLKSKESDSEKNAIKLLTETVSKQNGYWEVIGMTENNSKVNMIDYEGKLDGVTRIEIIFYWGSKKFHGKNWTPVNEENIYDLYKDK